MNRETAKRFYDAKLACEEIVAFVEGETYQSFLANRALQLAIERLLTIVGEAISVALRSGDSGVDVPFVREFIGLRNRLVHAYDNVDLEIIWDTATRDDPALSARLAEMFDGPQ